MFPLELAERSKAVRFLVSDTLSKEFNVSAIYVNFTDLSETAIDQHFGAPQDVAVYPNFGSVDATDSRWKTFYEAQPAFIKSYLPTPQ